MGWKELPRWLKYGIVPSSISLLLSSFLITIKSTGEIDSWGIFFINIFGIIPMLPVIFILDLIGLDPTQFSADISMAIGGAMGYFIWGAIIGLIVNNIKSKKQAEITVQQEAKVSTE